MSLDSRLNASTGDDTFPLLDLIDERKAGKLIECLDDGFIRLVDHMGDDAAIVQAARVSYGKGTKKTSDDRGLIRYLMRNRHTTPLEMVELKFHLRIPMDAWRQAVRHRTFSINEYSTRYSEAIDSQQATEPGAWRLQSTTNKQGSGAHLYDWPAGEERSDFDSPGGFLSAQERAFHKAARRVYERRLEFGVAREQARKDLPLSTYTEAYWKVDLHNLFHFLGLRLDTHAQLEIRTYAEAIAKLVQPIVPLAWEAFVDYRLNAMYFSGPEIETIRRLMSGGESGGEKISKRELEELQAKLSRLGLANHKEGETDGKEA